MQAREEVEKSFTKGLAALDTGPSLHPVIPEQDSPRRVERDQAVVLLVNHRARQLN